MSEPSNFKPPTGINFSCPEAISIATLSKDLRQIAAFLQHKFPYNPLQRFEDWWQHDGLHFYEGPIDMPGLFAIVGSPKRVYEAMPGEDYVRIGIASSDGKWYLRFYAYWEDEVDFPEGDYDITLSFELVEEFRTEVVPELEASLKEESSEVYFKRSIL